MQAMLERKTSKKNAYVKKEYTKGYKIPIISDAMFETMINNSSRKKYASLIISSVLKRDYDEIYNNIEYVKGNLDKIIDIEKRRVVDFICKLKNEYVGIEINNNYSRESYERNISYAMDIYKSKEIRGNKYSFNKVIQININNFTFEDNNEEVEEYALKNDKGEYLTEKIKIINIYLPNIRKKYYNKEKLSELDKVMLVLNEDDDEKLSKLYKGESVMEDYVKDAKDASISDDVVGLYDKELHEELLRNTELYNAERKGKESEIRKTIKRMLSKKVDIDLISEYTGLTKEEIEEIKESPDDEYDSYDKELHEELFRKIKREEAKQTAKKMLKDKLDINTIIKYTGLSREKIDNLNSAKM